VHVPPGTYRHFKKGDLYRVLGLGHDANDESRTVVVYEPLYERSGPPLAVRTVEDFLAWVDPVTRATVTEGTPGAVRRFTIVADTTSDSTGDA
jgi:hypothetical protein